MTVAVAVSTPEPTLITIRYEKRPAIPVRPVQVVASQRIRVPFGTARRRLAWQRSRSDALDR